MKVSLLYRRKQNGLSLIESVLSSVIILFILSASFMVINSTIIKSTTSEKRVQLTEQLDKKISHYILTGKFNGESIGDNSFSQVESSNLDLAKFVAKNEAFGIKISKEVIKYDSSK